MLPSINLGFTELSLYGPMFLIGYVLASLMVRRLSTRCGVGKTDAVAAPIWGAVGLIIGAKLVYFITRLPSIIENSDKFKELIKTDIVSALDYAFGGMVFYGGLIGFILGVIVYCKHFRIDVFSVIDLYTPFLPFVHAFGRIGCFLAGCCYGIEYHGACAVQFPYNEANPELSTVPRLPVQLIEAFLNFICFAVLFYLLLKNIKLKSEERKIRQGQLLGFYLAYYIVVRTVLEFFRDDTVRGGIGFLSTSQIISIILIPVAVYLILSKRKPITGTVK